MTEETSKANRPLRASANKWMLGLGAASLAAGAWIMWNAMASAQTKRAAVVQQMTAASPGSSQSKSEATPEPKSEQKPAKPSRSTADPAKVDQILESAGVYLKRDETPKAEAILRESVATYPDEPRLHAAYADLLVTQRRFEDAYAQYQAALATGTNDAKLNFTAGTIANKLGKSERAIEHYTAAQAADPKNAEYPLYLGQIQSKLGKNEDAKVSLLRAAKLDPNRAIAWGSLADIALRENKIDIALQHVKKARELEPQSTVWRVVEARALCRKGEAQQAMDLLVGLSDAEKNQPPVAKLIGECLGMLGDKEKAAEWMKKAEGK